MRSLLHPRTILMNSWWKSVAIPWFQIMVLTVSSFFAYDQTTRSALRTASFPDCRRCTHPVTLLKVLSVVFEHVLAHLGGTPVFAGLVGLQNGLDRKQSFGFEDLLGGLTRKRVGELLVRLGASPRPRTDGPLVQELAGDTEELH